MRGILETNNARMPAMTILTLSTAPRLRTALLAYATVLFLSPLGLGRAQEVLTVQEVLADPALFHLRQVTLKGTVRQVQPLDPYEIPAGSTCYGGYLFNLEDDTATLPVAVPGLCGVPMVKDPEVEDGARVVVDATIQAPSHGGYALSFKGSKIAMDQEGIVQAIVNRITPLVE